MADRRRGISNISYRLGDSSGLEEKMPTSLGSPDRRDLGLAALVVTAGILVFGWTIYSGISGMGDDLVRTTAPGTTDLDLQEAGEHTIFIESMSFEGGRFRSSGRAVPPGLEIEVVDLSSGEEVEVHPPRGRFSYRINSLSGSSIAAFTIDHPGIYRMNSRYSPGSEGPEVALAVGSGFTEKLIYAIFVSLAALFGSIILAAAILISASRRREMEAERLREEERLIRGRRPGA